MAMYANVLWSKVSNTAASPLWYVPQVIWDAQGKIVYDVNGKPVVAPLKTSGTGKGPAPPPAPGGDSDNIIIIGA